MRRWMLSRGIGVLALLALVALATPRSSPPVTIVYAQGGNVELVTGWTGPLDFRLLADGAAYNLTGMTVELILTAQDGTSISTSGDTSVTDAATGTVRYLPDSTDLVTSNSPISMRWKVTDGGGLIVFHPSGRPSTILVRGI